MPLASKSPYPIIVYSVTNYRPYILVTFGQICNFRDPNLVTFYFYELTHFLHCMKNTLLFIYRTNILVRLLTVNKNCLTTKNPKMCDPILVILLKMQPHYSQFSRENGALNSGTSLVASYKEVPPRVLNQLRPFNKRTFNLATLSKLQKVLSSNPASPKTP